MGDGQCLREFIVCPPLSVCPVTVVECGPHFLIVLSPVKIVLHHSLTGEAPHTRCGEGVPFWAFPGETQSTGESPGHLHKQVRGGVNRGFCRYCNGCFGRYCNGCFCGLFGSSVSLENLVHLLGSLGSKSTVLGFGPGFPAAATSRRGWFVDSSVGG